MTLMSDSYQPPPDLSTQAFTGIMSEPHESVLFMLVGLAVLCLVPIIMMRRRRPFDWSELIAHDLSPTSPSARSASHP